MEDEMIEREGVSVGYGRAWISARGPLAGLIVAIVLGWGVLSFLMWSASSASERSHTKITSYIALQTCVLSMSSEERVKMRTDLTRIGGRVQDALRLWCPWMGVENEPQ